MCAIGSLYASYTPRTANDDAFQCKTYSTCNDELANPTIHTDDSFAGVRRLKKRRANTFADQQVIFAREEAEEALAVGMRMFENAQSTRCLLYTFISDEYVYLQLSCS